MYHTTDGLNLLREKEMTLMLVILLCLSQILNTILHTPSLTLSKIYGISR